MFAVLLRRLGKNTLHFGLRRVLVTRSHGLLSRLLPPLEKMPLFARLKMLVTRSCRFLGRKIFALSFVPWKNATLCSSDDTCDSLPRVSICKGKYSPSRSSSEEKNRSLRSSGYYSSICKGKYSLFSSSSDKKKDYISLLGKYSLLAPTGYASIWKG